MSQDPIIEAAKELRACAALCAEADHVIAADMLSSVATDVLSGSDLAYCIELLRWYYETTMWAESRAAFAMAMDALDRIRERVQVERVEARCPS